MVTFFLPFMPLVIKRILNETKLKTLNGHSLTAAIKPTE